ncbi:hypothetical protein ACFRIB_52335 [Streptomyces mirabilis]|uniref:hypothetical protein n=1 Tax=Streptomyces mirabilis TaxID=68239 RepID=UPI0036C488E4
MVTSYTLCFGGLMLLGGRVADVFGAHRTVLAGIAVFTTASLVSGRAHAAGRGADCRRSRRSCCTGRSPRPNGSAAPR